MFTEAKIPIGTAPNIATKMAVIIMLPCSVAQRLGLTVK